MLCMVASNQDNVILSQHIGSTQFRKNAIQLFQEELMCNTINKSYTFIQL